MSAGQWAATLGTINLFFHLIMPRVGTIDHSQLSIKEQCKSCSYIFCLYLDFCEIYQDVTRHLSSSL